MLRQSILFLVFASLFNSVSTQSLSAVGNKDKNQASDVEDVSVKSTTTRFPLSSRMTYEEPTVENPTTPAEPLTGRFNFGASSYNCEPHGSCSGYMRAARKTSKSTPSSTSRSTRHDIFRNHSSITPAFHLSLSPGIIEQRIKEAIEGMRREILDRPQEFEQSNKRGGN